MPGSIGHAHALTRGLIFARRGSMVESLSGTLLGAEAMTAFPDPAPAVPRPSLHPPCALRRTVMPAYITLANFTDQGARAIKDSPDRFEAFKSLAESAGVTIKSVHWTTGAYDIVLVSEGAEDALMALNLKMAALGNIRTQTLRGFSIGEMRKLVAGLK
jgi:uncharacterized protein with GYD domain